MKDNMKTIMENWRRSLRVNDDYEYIESVYEEIFQLKYHGGWSFIEAYNLPIQIRRWFLRRLQKQFEKENEQVEKAQRKNK